jgi:hypothetical protein
MIVGSNTRQGVRRWKFIPSKAIVCHFKNIFIVTNRQLNHFKNLKIIFFSEEGLPASEEHGREADRLRVGHLRLGAPLQGRVNAALPSAGSHPW